VFCQTARQPYVELIHWLHQILEMQDSDFHSYHPLFCPGPLPVCATDMTAAAGSFAPAGATSIQDFSPHLEEAVERGWVFATLLFGESQVRTGHVIYALLETPSIKGVFLGLSRGAG